MRYLVLAAVLLALPTAARAQLSCDSTPFLGQCRGDIPAACTAAMRSDPERLPLYCMRYFTPRGQRLLLDEFARP